MGSINPLVVMGYSLQDTDSFTLPWLVELGK